MVAVRVMGTLRAGFRTGALGPFKYAAPTLRKKNSKYLYDFFVLFLTKFAGLGVNTALQGTRLYT